MVQQLITMALIELQIPAEFATGMDLDTRLLALDPQLSTKRAGSTLGYGYASTLHTLRRSVRVPSLSSLHSMLGGRSTLDTAVIRPRFFDSRCLPSPSFRILSPGAEARLDEAASTVDRTQYPAVQQRDSMSCVLRYLFLVFLIGDGERTLETRPSQFFHPAMSQPHEASLFLIRLLTSFFPFRLALRIEVGKRWARRRGRGRVQAWLGLDNDDFDYCVHAYKKEIVHRLSPYLLADSYRMQRLALRVQAPYFVQQHTPDAAGVSADIKYTLFEASPYGVEAYLSH
ncbi:hypothetical protein K438DRAFT_1969413 [Mycena galopus ATCC 62051]|nr:hypothetical protein K438DRAFT_1969413 [Mycena galopus ATCC 62051]